MRKFLNFCFIFFSILQCCFKSTSVESKMMFEFTYNLDFNNRKLVEDYLINKLQHLYNEPNISLVFLNYENDERLNQCFIVIEYALKEEILQLEVCLINQKEKTKPASPEKYLLYLALIPLAFYAILIYRRRKH